MGRFLKRTALGLLIGIWMTMSAAEEIAAKGATREQIKALDEEVQDIKKEILELSTEFYRFEEKFVFPPNTQLSIFLEVAQADIFRLDAVSIKIDGNDAAHHIYNPTELEALQRGGVQHIYTGNIRSGGHTLEVSLIGKSTSNKDYQQKSVYKFTKDVGTKLIKITLAGPDSSNQGISFKD